MVVRSLYVQKEKSTPWWSPSFPGGGGWNGFLTISASCWKSNPSSGEQTTAGMLVGVGGGGVGVEVEGTTVAVVVGRTLNVGVMFKDGVIEQPETARISIPIIEGIGFMVDLNYTSDSSKSVGT
jgi:hypothetical protein